MTTQSEQYDLKLRSTLYRVMLELQETCIELHEAEERADEDDAETHILKILDMIPDVVNAYFAVVEKGDERV